MTYYIKALVLLVTSLLFGFFIGAYGLEYYESTAFKPWSWSSPPVVINCYGPELSNIYLARGVDYWITRGESVSFIEEKFIKNVCAKEDIPGFIIMRKAAYRQLNSSTLAITKRKTTIMTGMVSATIYFQPGAYKLEHIIEHELGHAFGYTHVDAPSHIMNPSFGMMGDKFWIP